MRRPGALPLLALALLAAQGGAAPLQPGGSPALTKIYPRGSHWAVGCYGEGMVAQCVYDQFVINYDAVTNRRFACHTSHPGFESRCSQQKHLSENKLLRSPLFKSIA
ncbi:hypothetical protein GRJ2_002711800 [Grus japonensis]|uniref:Uncharacterized protein n=1 Tax=Grus japonensis TaxID=30415 RepID=A0ABC9Y020_GRUJA